MFSVSEIDMSTRASLEERLRAFQVDLPPRRLTIGERRWQSFVAGVMS